MDKTQNPSIRLVDDTVCVAIAGELEEELLTALGSSNQQGLNTSFTFEARDQDSDLIGGVVASCSYSWVNIKVVWVADHCRGQGLGRELVQQAHQHAQVLGCHSAWLDTSNHEARNFYLGLGYREFGLLANHGTDFPASHRRWFMQRRL